MQRPSVYSFTIKDPPGINIHRLRNVIGWSMRQLAENCHPELDHTTVRRVEHNEGFTQDTLERIAAALGKGLSIKLAVADLFLPIELADWPNLPERARVRIAESVQDAAAATRYKAHKTG